MIQFNGIFNSRLTVVIQFNKLFNSTDCSIQLKSNLIVCPYFSLSVSKIWNLANYRTFFGFFEATSHFFDNFFQYLIFFTKFNSTFYSFVNIFTKFNSKIYSFVISRQYSIQQIIHFLICFKIQFNNLFIFKYLGEIQFKNIFKMLKLAVFNSIKYSFNKKSRVSNRANWKR